MLNIYANSMVDRLHLISHMQRCPYAACLCLAMHGLLPRTGSCPEAAGVQQSYRCCCRPACLVCWHISVTDGQCCMLKFLVLLAAHLIRWIGSGMQLSSSGFWDLFGCCR